MVANARISLLLNYPPEYHHEWGNKCCYSQLRLDALDRPSAEQMLGALLSDNVELTPLKRLNIERSGGNPFFIEEMVQALFNDGTLARNGTLRIVHPLSQLQLPPTVQGILASRMDRLPTDHKQLLQTLAVIGRDSPLNLVRKLCPYGERELESILAHLQTTEFIYEQPGAAGAEYVFKHALTQEVAYNSLLIAYRKLLHQRAGAAIEEVYAGRLDDHVNELAHHYTHCNNFSKAVEYLGREGQQDMQRSAYGDAVRSFNAALQLLQKLPDGPDRVQRELMLQQAVGSATIAVKGWPRRKWSELSVMLGSFVSR